LVDAPLRVRTPSGELTFRVKNGLARVSPEGVIVLADSVEETHA
jgi:F0F1-type ATP synthase epsilon subunit